MAKIETFNLGGFTTDIRKVEYILTIYKLKFENILSESIKTTALTFGMFVSERCAVAFKIG